MVRLSEKISKFRKAQKLTQEQLGEKLGVSGQAVSKWENGTSMPDIMLLTELCDILDVSVDALLEMPVTIKNKNIVQDFCAYARENGRAKTVLNIIASLFNDSSGCKAGKNCFFSSEEIRVSDEHGMGFIIDGETIKNDYIAMNNEDIAYFLRILTDEVSLSVIKQIEIDNVITRDEIMERLSLEKDTVDAILLGLMKRNLIDSGFDDNGKRGYRQAVNMIGVWMIFAGCNIVSCGGNIVGAFHVSRK